MTVACREQPNTANVRDMAAKPTAIRPSKDVEKDGSLKEIYDQYYGPIAEVTSLTPKYFIADYWYTRFHAEGVWVMDGGTIAWPVNSGVISCDRTTMQCTDLTAFVFNGLLTSDLTTREVERWDEHEIVTKPNDAECVRSTIRINREQQSVAEVQNVFRADGPCKGMTIGEQHLHLDDGLRVANQIRSERMSESNSRPPNSR